MTTKIDINKKYQYRNGQPARILTTEAKEKRTGTVVSASDNYGFRLHLDDGREWGVGDEESEFDLIEVADPEPLRLEAGKYYKNRRGEVVVPLEKSDTITAIFQSAEGAWFENGRVKLLQESPEDIISEHPAPSEEDSLCRDKDFPKNTKPVPEGFAFLHYGFLNPWAETTDEVDDVRCLIQSDWVKTEHARGNDIGFWALRIGSEIARKNGLETDMGNPMSPDFPAVGTRLRFTKEGFYEGIGKLDERVLVTYVSKDFFQTDTPQGGYYEFYQNWRDGLEVVPDPPTPPVRPEGEGWRVPISEKHTFGSTVRHGLTDLLVILLHRNNHGWKTPDGHAHVSLPHQIYTESLKETIGCSKEIVVVGLNSGRWVTIWAESDSNILHPSGFHESQVVAGEGDDIIPDNVKDHTIHICQDCLDLKGECCHEPACVFCRHSMSEVRHALDLLMIRPILDGPESEPSPTYPPDESEWPEKPEGEWERQDFERGVFEKGERYIRLSDDGKKWHAPNGSRWVECIVFRAVPTPQWRELGPDEKMEIGDEWVNSTFQNWDKVGSILAGFTPSGIRGDEKDPSFRARTRRPLPPSDVVDPVSGVNVPGEFGPMEIGSPDETPEQKEIRQAHNREIYHQEENEKRARLENQRIVCPNCVGLGCIADAGYINCETCGASGSVSAAWVQDLFFSQLRPPAERKAKEWKIGCHGLADVPVIVSGPAPEHWEVITVREVLDGIGGQPC